MDNLITNIDWTLHDFCKSQCTYCPISLRGGTGVPDTSEYLRVANLIIDSYLKKQGRKINWTFNGGEPLDMDDIAMLLKLCKNNGESVTLHTNGGKLWMDWWAIEPHVDNLHLTFHHWQNPALIKYITQTFTNKNKIIHITAPIRPENFNEDISRVVELENDINYNITKTILYKNADSTAGMLSYTFDQIGQVDFYNKPPDERKRILEEMEQRRLREEEERRRILEELERLKNLEPEPIPEPVYEQPVVEYDKPKPLDIPPPVEQRTELMEEKIYFMETSWDERYNDRYNAGPSYAGQLCNAGVEKLVIGAQGWVSGSNCNNQPLGNIWHLGWTPPQGPQKCGMISCIDINDQKITKFSN